MIAKKRPPFMTLQRWLFVSIAALLLFITVFFIYYRDIQMPQWSAISDAKAKAVDAANLVEVENIYKHVWNTESWIVEGIDDEDNEVFVWITEDTQPKIIKAFDSVSSRSINDSFKAAKPDAVVKRIQPGLLDGQPVWEIYYSIGQGPARYFYEFYTFDSGTFISVYRLPAKTEP
ncbi:MAG: DUF5590 domain-containing protein [Bacillota bacterium]